MDESGNADHEFPGFQICVPKDELVVFRRSLSSRLQRRAPRPLLVESKVAAASASAAVGGGGGGATSSSYNSFIYQSKDPIPLLSPLVLPSLLESSYLHQAGNTAK
ncbi:hypothetical protein CCACVL1_06436 [Corchorus capsularis]|uniref:Uncharacterized protein n=1 Tax=Corchorus capsularis TaxID=210143 RepID=A0A1R3JFL2_COCAP|nr:hypothetical protein CCACVL1_06436 [Corchorus capsularis]